MSATTKIKLPYLFLPFCLAYTASQAAVNTAIKIFGDSFRLTKMDNGRDLVEMVCQVGTVCLFVCVCVCVCVCMCMFV